MWKKSRKHANSNACIQSRQKTNLSRFRKIWNKDVRTSVISFKDNMYMYTTSWERINSVKPPQASQKGQTQQHVTCWRHRHRDGRSKDSCMVTAHIMTYSPKYTTANRKRHHMSLQRHDDVWSHLHFRSWRRARCCCGRARPCASSCCDTPSPPGPYSACARWCYSLQQETITQITRLW